MDTPSFLAVASGGAAGAVARWQMGLALTRGLGWDAAWATCGVNVAGAFALGLAAALLAARQGALPLLVTVGFLGAFTTFSTFAMDAAGLAARSWGLAAAYLCASVSLALLAFLGGAALGRAL